MAGDIAVVGLGAVFPGAPDVHTFWRNIAAGHDAISELPEGRWDEVFYDPTADAVDRVYCRRGGFLGRTVPFDAGAFGIMPVAATGAEPDQMLALDVAAATLDDAGIELDDDLRRSTTVVLGRGSYVTAGMVRLDQKVRGAQQAVSLVAQLVPGLDPSVLATLKAELQAQAGHFGPDTAIGLVPNLTASRIANRLDLQGPAYTVDAACASALLAVEHGVRELRSGRSALALVGGVHLTQDITFWSVFAQLGALSRQQQIRPFSASADGLLIGEGVGMLALQRLEDAKKQRRRIYAVLEGVGSASDGRASSVMVPRVDGQLLALQRAWDDAGADPSTMTLLEAHGTATKAGDAAERATIARFFADGPPAALGSVKSMIGHAMPAAGAAGLIKTVLALYHRTIPPSLHCDDPHPELAATRFDVPGTSRFWDSDTTRRAGVNAFGFGGIDAHVVLREPRRSRRSHPPRPTAHPVHLAADSPEALLDALRRGDTGGTGRFRLALLDDDPKRRTKAETIVSRGAPWHGRGGIWFSSEGLARDGVALLFPGVEARFDPDVAAIAEAFDHPAPRAADPDDLEQVGMGLVETGRLLDHVVRALGVTPVAMAGHSVGEWVGMICSGMLSTEEADRFLGSLQAGSLEVPGVLFAAAATDVDTARAALEGLDDIAISHDNCPRQVLLCGVEAAIHTARDRLVAGGAMVQVLPFRSGFHSPLFADFLAPMQAHLGRITLSAPHTPLYSATLADRFPDDLDAVRDIAMRHLVEAVRFREMVESLYADGVRSFVVAGQGSLGGFVSDTLKGRPHLAITALHDRYEGLLQIRDLALGLWVEGADVDLARVLPDAPSARLRVDLDLRTPLLRASRPLPVASETRLPTDSPVLAALAAGLDAVRRAQTDVAEAWQSSAPASSRRSLTLSVDTHPYLRDHAFFPQPPGWPDVADTYPVVPMTMMVELLLQEAEALFPGRVAVEVRDMMAMKWLAVHPAADVVLTAEQVGPDEVVARIEGYCEAHVHLADRYPTPPAPSMPPLADPRPVPQDPDSLYGQRWMFHGPEYQGITGLGPWDETGIDGQLTTPEAMGALVDNAGQVFGYWLMCARQVDRLALPVRLARIARFSPHPAAGSTLDCQVRITACTDEVLACDLELVQAGRVWCRVEG
jgi:acyl transferase domain-containing protein